MITRKETLRGSLVLVAVALTAGCGPDEPISRVGTAQAGDQTISNNATPVLPSSYAKGLDVSVYEGNIDWPTVRASGKVFAFIRVSDGLNHPDAKFATNWSGARAAGVIRGAYQFFRPELSATAQANLLLQKMGTLQPGDMPPTLDVEVTDGISPSGILAGVNAWAATIEQATGTTPIIYCSPGFWDPLGAGAEPEALWVAHWGVAHPRVPASWSNWTFWQYTATGSVSGISSSQVDLDVFQGTLADLQAWVGSSPTPSPSPSPTPTPGGSGNLIVNGGFEGSLSGWTLGGVQLPLDSVVHYHTGRNSLRLGANSLPGQVEPNGDSWGYQTVTIPSTATSAVLTFWYYPYSTDLITYDWQDAQVQDASGNTLINVFHICSDTQLWTQQTVDLSAYAGQTLRVYFNAHGEGTTDPTTLWVDDVSLMVQ